MANPTTDTAGISWPRRLVGLLLILVNLPTGVLGAHASEVTAEISVAVASNFLAAETELARVFEQQSGYRVITSSGSTGMLFTQIVQGAPFDLFMAADTARPRKLIELGFAAEESFFIYATGGLVLWCPAAASTEEAKAMLLNKRYKYLAIANPKTAPYGKAAVEAMRALGVDEGESAVLGENISQTYQFVQTGHAGLGFVALSQIIGRQPEGAFWRVPERLYSPVRQAAVLLNSAGKKEAVQAFLAFLNSSQAMAIIASYGYAVD